MVDHLREAIQHIEHKWPDLPTMVVGDVMLDRYVFGDVVRISPEAPVPVVCAKTETAQPGGAANVAMNLAGLGSSALLIGFAGRDENRHLLEKSLRANRIEP